MISIPLLRSHPSQTYPNTTPTSSPKHALPFPRKIHIIKVVAPEKEEEFELFENCPPLILLSLSSHMPESPLHQPSLSSLSSSSPSYQSS